MTTTGPRMLDVERTLILQGPASDFSVKGWKRWTSDSPTLATQAYVEIKNRFRLTSLFADTSQQACFLQPPERLASPTIPSLIGKLHFVRCRPPSDRPQSRQHDSRSLIRRSKSPKESGNSPRNAEGFQQLLCELPVRDCGAEYRWWVSDYCPNLFGIID